MLTPKTRRPSHLSRVLLYTLLACALLVLVSSLRRMSVSSVEVSSQHVSVRSDGPCSTKTSRFAYVFYATKNEYFCSALINVHQLRYNNLTSPSTPILLFHLSSVDIPPELLQQAARLNVSLHNVRLGSLNDGIVRDTLIKLSFWRLTAFDRIIHLNADLLLLRSIDHLFCLPKVNLAVPRAYWRKQPFFSTMLMVITPDNDVYQRLSSSYIPNGKLVQPHYKVDLFNKKFHNEALILPNIYAALDIHLKKPDHVHGPNPYLLLRRDAFLLYFIGNDKPWHFGNSSKAITSQWPNAHPAFYEFYQTWWSLTRKVCYWNVVA